MLPASVIQLSTELVSSATSQSPVSGLTHDFYRYPARFSPLFARSVVNHFSDKQELVLDPFMGGGTCLVEALSAGRRAAGCDINSLAVFVSRVKTTRRSAAAEARVLNWVRDVAAISLSEPMLVDLDWRGHEYLRNIGGRSTWAIRDSIGRALAQVGKLKSRDDQELARCILLRTGQWAIDGRRNFPSATEFRGQLVKLAHEMIGGSKAFRETIENTASPLVAHVPAESIPTLTDFQEAGPPRLVLTSPPYPGVHVLYHRWQLNGGLETPAPFWIAACQDGHGESHYTFGHRRSHCRRGTYYDHLERSFRALTALAESKTLFVQVVGFSSPEAQLPRYLKTMERSGLEEVMPKWLGQKTRRLWRQVPNRRWYNWTNGGLSSEREVVLFHRKRR